jgi:hypothetical protein
MSLALLSLARTVCHSVGFKSVNDSVRPGIAGDLSSAPSAVSSTGDQIDLASEEPTVQDLPQTRLDKTPLPFWRGLTVVHREQDVVKLLPDSEYLRDRRLLDSCPAA